MKYKAIIFDIGDTLLEYYPTQKQIYIARLKCLDFDIDEATEENIANTITNTANEQIIKEQNGAPRMPDEDFETMLDKAALCCFNIENVVDKYLDRFRKIPSSEQKLNMIPNTKETLQTLKDRGFRLGIVSNHRKWMPDYLKEIGLSQFFETIIISDIVGVEKPDVRIMQIALDSLSLNADSCLYVGDHPFDVLCAKNAGIDCAWLTKCDNILPDSVPYKEDYRIQSINELLYKIKNPSSNT